MNADAYNLSVNNGGDNMDNNDINSQAERYKQELMKLYGKRCGDTVPDEAVSCGETDEDARTDEEVFGVDEDAPDAAGHHAHFQMIPHGHRIPKTIPMILMQVRRTSIHAIPNPTFPSLIRIWVRGIRRTLFLPSTFRRNQWAMQRDI